MSPQVEAELQGAGWQVQRVAGPDRVATAAAVASLVAARSGGAGQVLLATAHDWPDAAAAGAYGARAGVPVLLTGPGQLSAATAAALRDLRPRRVVALGGSAALSDTVIAQTGAVRLAGPTRQGTAAIIARDLWGRTSASVARRWVVTPGDDWAWPYVLSAASTAARRDAPVLLAGPTVSDELRAYVSSLGYPGTAPAELIVHGPVPAGVLAEVRRLTQ